MINIKQSEDGVFYVDAPIKKIGHDEIEFLKSKAMETVRKKARLCMHNRANDIIHEMLIIHYRDAYVRPHKHLKKSESFHVIEGSADLIIFDDNGKIKNVVSLSDYYNHSENHQFYFKIEEPSYHSLLIDSDFLVFSETTNGPFNRDDTIFAPWSPSEGEVDCEQFLKKISCDRDSFSLIQGRQNGF